MEAHVGKMIQLLGMATLVAGVVTRNLVMADHPAAGTGAAICAMALLLGLGLGITELIRLHGEGGRRWKDVFLHRQ